MDVQTNDSNQLQTLRNLITEILFENTAYDCIPVNSSISSVDKSMTLADVINILIEEEMDELLVWDQEEAKWIWMLSVVDIIRLILHSLRAGLTDKTLCSALFIAAFVHFQLLTPTYSLGGNQTIEDAQINASAIVSPDPKSIAWVHSQMKLKSLSQIIEQISTIHSKCEGNNDEQERTGSLYEGKLNVVPQRKPYIRLKSVMKESKLSYIILTMIVEKIHRVLIEDADSKMMISILNFKDVLLYLLRIANESPVYICNRIAVKELLDSNQVNKPAIEEGEPLWKGFELLADVHRSLWITVVGPDNQFRGMLFREDFREIMKNWQLHYLWMPIHEFLAKKAELYHGLIPEYRFFTMEEVTKDIIWKIVMTRRNAIVCLDTRGEVVATIGLMELFSLYVQEGPGTHKSSSDTAAGTETS